MLIGYVLSSKIKSRQVWKRKTTKSWMNLNDAAQFL